MKLYCVKCYKKLANEKMLAAKSFICPVQFLTVGIIIFKDKDVLE